MTRGAPPIRALIVHVWHTVRHELGAFSRTVYGILIVGLAIGQPIASYFGLPVPDEVTWWRCIQVSIVVFLVGVIQSLARHSYTLEERATPRFRVWFDKEGAGCAEAVERISSGSSFHEVKATYIRVTVENLATSVITDCVAYCIGLQVAESESKSFDVIPIPQPIQLGGGAFALYPGIQKPIDILRVNEENNVLSVIGPWPLHLRDALLESPRLFLFRIRVSAAGATREIGIVVHWKGIWNNVAVREAD